MDKLLDLGHCCDLFPQHAAHLSFLPAVYTLPHLRMCLSICIARSDSELVAKIDGKGKALELSGGRPGCPIGQRVFNRARIIIRNLCSAAIKRVTETTERAFSSFS